MFVNGHDDRFKFVGNLAEKNGSLRLSDVTLLDEGVYTCIFTLFPTGNYQAEIHLNVHVTRTEVNAPVVGDKEVPLASCTAAGSKPPAVVTWKTGTLEEKVRSTMNSTLQANDTTTTVSSLWGIPSREINGSPVRCVITTPALPREEILSITIQVSYPPGKVSVNHISKSSFECVAEANPPPQFTWARPGQPPALQGSTLDNAYEDGLYQCEASNKYGRSCRACETILAILLILFVFSVLAFGYFYKSKDWDFDLPRRKRPRNEEGTDEERHPARAGSDLEPLEFQKGPVSCFACLIFALVHTVRSSDLALLLALLSRLSGLVSSIVSAASIPASAGVTPSLFTASSTSTSSSTASSTTFSASTSAGCTTSTGCTTSAGCTTSGSSSCNVTPGVSVVWA
ncbi:hypothetical protein INR49_021944 [Caranx melampygus]|nr:hypothetical protein INR49_021944 [Caranx melampygus]